MDPAVMERPVADRPVPDRAVPDRPVPDRPVIASRPRTLVATIDPPLVSAIVVSPAGATSEVRAPVAADASPATALAALWAAVEQVGEFDRISAGFAAPVRDGVTLGTGAWAAFPLAAELARQSLRPARAVSLAELAVPLEHTGVELVLTLGDRFESALFLHGARAPGFALGAARFRKQATYADYLSPAAFAKVGRKKWNRRAHRVLAELLAVFAPHRLYLTGRDARLIYGDLPAQVTVVAGLSREAALALWA